jgi:hypothetical protein
MTAEKWVDLGILIACVIFVVALNWSWIVDKWYNWLDKLDGE